MSGYTPEKSDRIQGLLCHRQVILLDCMQVTELRTPAMLQAQATRKATSQRRVT